LPLAGRGDRAVIREAIVRLADRQNLSAADASVVMGEILAGEATPAQIAAFAVALRMKGETDEEVAALARALRSNALPFPLPAGIAGEHLLDTCGTGGDGSGTINVSTAVAFVAAGAGARVAKHGNRAASSRAGSADCLESLGVHLELAPEEASACLERTGVVFLFAQHYHAGYRHAASPRREIGVRTVFNALGPLANPAGAGRQLVGVFASEWVPRLARVLGLLGARAACVVHSEDGWDELSVFAPTRVAWLEDGRVREETVDPRALGLAHGDREKVMGGEAAENAERMRALLGGAEKGVARDLILLNSAAALRVAGLASDWESGLATARESLDSGRALGRLEALIQFCRSRPK
jgi:anthranilate phosphoribosyltransferase